MLLLSCWSVLEQKNLLQPPVMTETCVLLESSSGPWLNLTKTWKVSPTPCGWTSYCAQRTLKATFSDHVLYNECRRYR